MSGFHIGDMNNSSDLNSGLVIIKPLIVRRITVLSL